MYLFIDGVRKTDFKKEEQELKALFPQAFSKDNFQPITINQAGNSGVLVDVYVKGDTNNPLRRRVLRTPPTKISCKGDFFGDDGLRHKWALSDSLPEKDRDGNYTIKTKSIDVGHATMIDPRIDMEKLVAFYYYSPNFRNGKNGGKSSKFEFVIPAAQSKSRIETVAAQTKYSNELLMEGSRMSYDKVKEIYHTLGLALTNIEADDRVTLFDFCVANINGFVERYERAKANIEALEAAGRNNGAVKVNDIVNKAIKGGLLVEEGAFWVLKNENGGEVMKVTEVRGDKAQAKKLSLVEHFTTNPQDLDTVVSLVG